MSLPEQAPAFRRGEHVTGLLPLVLALKLALKSAFFHEEQQRVFFICNLTNRACQRCEFLGVAADMVQRIDNQSRHLAGIEAAVPLFL